jgi:hypothetical protein
MQLRRPLLFKRAEEIALWASIAQENAFYAAGQARKGIALLHGSLWHSAMISLVPFSRFFAIHGARDIDG